MIARATPHSPLMPRPPSGSGTSPTEACHREYRASGHPPEYGPDAAPAGDRRRAPRPSDALSTARTARHAPDHAHAPRSPPARQHRGPRLAHPATAHGADATAPAPLPSAAGPRH